MGTFLEIFCGSKDNVVFAINKTLQTKNVKIVHTDVVIDALGDFNVFVVFEYLPQSIRC